MKYTETNAEYKLCQEIFKIIDKQINLLKDESKTSV